jgi:putative ABC transport system permease protein
MIWATVIMALREIRRNKMRSVLTTLGIVIGVASVVAMVTLGHGASAKITSEISALGTNLLIVLPGTERRGPTTAASQPLKVDDARAMERDLTAVGLVAPTATYSALVVYGDKNWSTAVTGAGGDYFEIRGYKFERGAAFNDAEVNAGATVCVLGDTIRRKLFGAQEPIGATIRVGSVACSVTGVVAPKGQSTFGMDQDDFIVMPLATFQRRLAGNSDVSAIFVSAVDNKETERAKQQIRSLMRERRHTPPGAPEDFEVQDMKEISKTLGGVTGALTALLGAIAGVSLLVGGIGIMNIMLVSVTERTREIGIRMAIGARAREVLFQFLVEAVALSSLGGGLGMALGVLGSYVAARAIGLPFEILSDVLFLAFGFSAVVGVGFGFVPARKAARLKPIDALRYE